VGDIRTHKLIRFGVFELDLEAGELRKQGIRIKLPGKPLQVLQALLENPGHVVTREELRRRLWPQNTFVDFDNGLNTAVKRLRIALGDSAESPRFIETLSRAGYRFIAPAPEVVSESDPGFGVVQVTAPVASTRKRWMWPSAAGVSVVLAAGLLLYFVRTEPAVVKYRQITFGRGQISGARFAPDGQNILYTASWNNGPRQMFLTNAVSPESRLLGFPEARLVSVSSHAELALLSSDGTMPIRGGRLSRVPMNGGAPAPVAQEVMTADWANNGRDLAIVRAVAGENQIEFPIGHVVSRTPGWISSLRISPRNDQIAYLEHPVRHDDAGSVKVVDRNGTVRTLSGGWSNVAGLAWHPRTGEVWFTAARDGVAKSLWAVTPRAALRPVAQAPGNLNLRDIASDGRVLVSRDSHRLEIAGHLKGDDVEHDLSWLDESRAQDLSADGKLVLLDESGEGTGGHFVTYLQRTDDHSTVRLGDGRAMALAPGAGSALVLGCEDRTRLRILPIGLGQPRDLPVTGLEYQWARYFPDGRRLLVMANEPQKPLRLYVQPLDGKPVPFSQPLVTRNVAIAPDGSRIAVLPADGRLTLYPSEPGDPRVIPSNEPLAPIAWSRHGRFLFVQHLARQGEVPARISRLNVSTGRVTPWKRVAPKDSMGVNFITRVLIAADEESFVFTYRRVLSELFVVEGWR
jgi:DNA-binding winged helix-turn-helix (wHTH) protein